ncbi:Chromosome transmission fidelity protein 18 [Chytriomyces hyalinus]|nr:Chromosome transmission fidelity protein 18 [Chytriomyces hyalinus]
MALCQLTDGDIRSCLNTCQFFKRLGKLRLNVDLLKRYDVGRKDMTRSLFTVWEDLFMILGAKRRKNGLVGGSAGGTDGGKDKDANRYIHRLLSLIAASGETGKILEGCFENYLRMNIVDAWDGGATTSTSSGAKKGGKIEQALDWLCFHDKIERFIVKDRDFELFKYQPFVLEAPVDVGGRGGDGKYVQEKGEDGHYLFKLLPAIDKLIVGNESVSNEAVSFQQLQISNPVKQLIGNQVEMEAIRQANVSSKERGRKAAGSQPILFKNAIDVGQAVATEDSNAASSSPKRPEVALTQTKIVPKIVAPAKLETVAKDFFGRPIIVIDDDGNDDSENNEGVENGAGKVIKKKSNAAASKRNEPTVSFRYNEGFSNAVRTPMKISDFM